MERRTMMSRQKFVILLVGIVFVECGCLPPSNDSPEKKEKPVPSRTAQPEPAPAPKEVTPSPIPRYNDSSQRTIALVPTPEEPGPDAALWKKGLDRDEQTLYEALERLLALVKQGAAANVDHANLDVVKRLRQIGRHVQDSHATLRRRWIDYRYQLGQGATKYRALVREYENKIAQATLPEDQKELREYQAVFAAQALGADRRLQEGEAWFVKAEAGILRLERSLEFLSHLEEVLESILDKAPTQSELVARLRVYKKGFVELLDILTNYHDHLLGKSTSAVLREKADSKRRQEESRRPWERMVTNKPNEASTKSNADGSAKAQMVSMRPTATDSSSTSLKPKEDTPSPKERYASQIEAARSFARAYQDLLSRRPVIDEVGPRRTVRVPNPQQEAQWAKEVQRYSFVPVDYSRVGRSVHPGVYPVFSRNDQFAAVVMVSSTGTLEVLTGQLPDRAYLIGRRIRQGGAS
jgi:hypothetical protein